jgi:hypothetical protein
MKRQARSDEFNTLLFGLTNESVEFRNRWRGLAGLAIWLILSGLSMVIMLLGSGAKGQLNIAIVIGISLVKYVPLLMVVYNLARVMAARYLDDVYELDDEDLASDFLEEVTFGYGHEKITINEGAISEKDEQSPLILIGGPGKIQVNLDSIALLETVTGEPEIIYPRSDPWKLGRFERVREIGRSDEAGQREYAIINLRDQFLDGLSIKSRTKDGILLEAHDIKIIFSILRRQAEKDKVQGDAYLFDERAVQALVYNQTIITPEPAAPSGIPFPWDTTVIPLVIFELEELIKSHNLGEILASISQKELDTAFTNDQTMAQMRLEMTGHQVKVGARRAAPNFESRSKITAQFFEKEFREKAAKLGVAIEWIDIGTWQLPSTLILEKHKKAWELSRQNAGKRSAVERSKKKHEMDEILKLVDTVIIKNYEKKIASRSDARKMSNEEIEKLGIEELLEYQQQLQVPQGGQKKNPKAIAQEMLHAFRIELRGARELIEKENKSLEEKTADLNSIDKALYNISQLTTHWIKKP